MNTLSSLQNHKPFLTLRELCQELSISTATGRNWLRAGRLIPDSFHEDRGNAPLFSSDYADSLKKSLLDNQDSLLKSRRNKTYISGNQFYHSYLTADSPNSREIKLLLQSLPGTGAVLSDDDIRILLAECALRLCIQAESQNAETPACFLKAYIDDFIPLPCRFQFLIDELLPSRAYTRAFIRRHPEFLSVPYTYIPGEDLLGLLYLSLKNMGVRKSRGAYYTPLHIVRKLLNELPVPTAEDTLLDPCCGTGNFLLQLPDCWNLSQIYGWDTDSLSITITRLNLSLKYPEADMETLNTHILHKDFLLAGSALSFNYIIGNPPWGSAFTEEEKTRLRREYSCGGTNPESYDLFLEKGLACLKQNGRLSFVLPESILTVKSHRNIRRLILRDCNIHSLTCLGNAFDGVQCPSVILQLVKTNHQLRGSGIRVSAEQTFVIQKNRALTEEGFHLLIPDEDYTLLQKIENHVPAQTLKGHADFALGIVTGSNRQFLSSRQEEGLEPILKGSDIQPYHISRPGWYIAFHPENFQQTAPEALYRAPEKLLYRFISRKLVFAYDDHQTLSLNSCNLLVPHMDGLHIKYILTVLNSRTAQFLFQKKWNSLKVLRSHLEQIPIPVISAKAQDYYISMASAIMNACEPAEQLSLYNEADKAIAGLFSLTSEEYARIMESTI